jgi:hypothetical protein
VITDLTVPGAVTVNLPAGQDGRIFVIADGKGDAATNNITINRAGGDTINGATSFVLNTNKEAVVLQFNNTGANWHIVSNYDTSAVTTTGSNTGSNRLQNKDLDDDNCGFVDSADTTKRIEFEASGQTTGTTTTLATTSTTSKTLTFPDLTDTIVSRTSTDTSADRLQNKHFSDNNCLFVDESDTTKRLAFQLSGNTAGATTTLSTINTSNTTLTLPFNGTILSTTAAAIITNKDYDGGTASDNLRMTLPKNTTGNLNALTRKEGTVVYDTTTDTVKFDNGSNLVELASATTVQDAVGDVSNLSISASVGASALTINLLDKSGSTPSVGSPVNIGFRSSTLTTGTYAVRSATAAVSLVVSSGSTLGQISATADYLYVYALDNAGTIELAISSTLYDEGSRVTTVAEGGAGAADSRTVIYSTTARSNVAIRFIGRLYQSQATAGTWASAPTEVATGIQLIQPRMDDIHATQLGLKTYAHGTTYNGGNAPTITSNLAGLSVIRSCFQPYQDQAGVWFLRFTFVANVTSGSRGGGTFTIAGLTFKNTTDYTQAVTAAENTFGVYCQGYVSANTGTVNVSHGTATTARYQFQAGCLELESKPSWAY